MSQDLNYFHYGVDEGLPSSQVHDIIQDDYGNLWFSTDQGLAKYNGYTFSNYTTKDGLTDNIVFKFFKQKNGKIWCTTFGKSLFYFSGDKTVFKAYRFNSYLTGLKDSYIANSLHVTDQDEVFLSVLGGTGYVHIGPNGKIITDEIRQPILQPLEIALINNSRGPCFFYTKPLAGKRIVSGNWDTKIFSNQHNFSDDFIKACYLNEAKQAVFTNPRQILIISGKGDSINIPSRYEPISLGQLTESTFWVGYRYGGIDVFDLRGKKINNFLPGKSVTKLLVDHEGSYWFSTLNDGVYHAKSTFIKSFTAIASTNTWVNSLSGDKNGNLNIGFYNGDVAIVKSGIAKNIHISSIKKPAFTNSDLKTGISYYMTDNNLYRVGQNTPLYDLKIFPLSFYVHTNDTIVIASYNGIKVIHNQTELSIATGGRVNDVCFNKQFYLATNKGLFVLNGKTPLPAFDDSILFASRIIDIDSWNGKLILATKGSGVLIIHNKKVQQIDAHDGLSNNIVSEVYVENDSVIWACTNSGLNRISFKNNRLNEIRIISNHDGLISNEVTDIEFMNDTVWVGTRGGLCSFPKLLLDKSKKTIHYFLSITQFKVNDELWENKSNISLSHYQNRIEFAFRAISFFEFKPIEYRFRLKGLETKWNYTKALSIVYSSLPPGNYTFILQAKGNNKSWKNGTQQFSFHIFPPFWKTWWFLITVIILVGILIYLFFRFRILSYNRDITRELLRQLLKRLTRKTNYVVFREQGKDIRIATNTICYIKADGNYIEIHTDSKKYVIRYKIGEFLELVPDPLEYLRISRSYIIRLDKVQEKSKKDVSVCGQKIAVGETYLDQLEKIKF